MSYVEQYKGYGWVKSGRYTPDPNASREDAYQTLLGHHVAETMFLINEVRKLAKLLDESEAENRAMISVLKDTPRIGEMCAKVFLDRDSDEAIEIQAWLDRRREFVEGTYGVYEEGKESTDSGI